MHGGKVEKWEMPSCRKTNTYLATLRYMEKNCGQKEISFFMFYWSPLKVSAWSEDVLALVVEGLTGSGDLPAGLKGNIIPELLLTGLRALRFWGGEKGCVPIIPTLLLAGLWNLSFMGAGGSSSKGGLLPLANKLWCHYCFHSPVILMLLILLTGLSASTDFLGNGS